MNTELSNWMKTFVKAVLHVDPFKGGQERVVITPVIAAALLSCNFRGQRRLDSSRVNKYAAAMRRGEWLFLTDAITVAIRCTGGEYSWHLITGQHRLEAVVKTGCNIPALLVFDYCESDSELEQKYAATNNGKPLTMGQGLHALDVYAAIGLPKDIINATQAGLTFLGTNFGTQRRDAHFTAVQIRDLLIAWDTPLRAYNIAISGAATKERDWFLRAPVIAIGLLTFRFKPEVAVDFWKSAADNNGLRKGEPAHSLHTKLSYGMSTDASGRKIAAIEVTRCWNAHYEGRSLQLVRTRIEGDVLIPKVFGTPFDGKNGLDILGVAQA